MDGIIISVFEALVAASSTNASSTVFVAGMVNTSVGGDYAPDDNTIVSPTRGFFFLATSTDDWIAYAKDGTANYVQANTGVASTTNRATPQKLTIFVNPKPDGTTSASYFIDGKLVAILNLGAVPGARTPLYSRVSVGARVAGLAKQIQVGYIRIWLQVAR